MSDEVQMIPIERIRILNPRHRDRRKFDLIIQSIRNLGLKKPIQVSLRSGEEAEGPGYDLVCGQGRIEAFTALGHLEIPAIVVEVPREERLLRSLVENLARRFPQPQALIAEIERLKALGHTNTAIGLKLDISDTAVANFLALAHAGEERLLHAALNGTVPLGVAIDIAKTDSAETQRELLKAYESKQLNYRSIRTVKRLMDQRRLLGRQRGGAPPRRSRTSAEGLVNAYRRESQRQKLLVRKARICESRLVFVVRAFDRLLTDVRFRDLLRAESLAAMPTHLWEKLDPNLREAA
jgi:ParB family chromosome partitioning protein